MQTVVGEPSINREPAICPAIRLEKGELS